METIEDIIRHSFRIKPHDLGRLNLEPRPQTPDKRGKSNSNNPSHLYPIVEFETLKIVNFSQRTSSHAIQNLDAL